MARLQILELPTIERPDGTEETPFVLVLDQASEDITKTLEPPADGRPYDAALRLQGLIAEQGDVCAICAKPCSTGRALALDHDHETGQFRGLLCAHCNMAIGQLQDSVEILRSALAYLVKWKSHATANESVLDARVS